MKDDFLYIKVLLGRFFEGETSNEEEKTLFRFFGGDSVPKELEQYRPVLKYFESGLADEMNMREQPESANVMNISEQQKPVMKKSQHLVVLNSKRKRWIIRVGVAASFLIIFFSSVYLFTSKESGDPYSGSYIIRNGIRITDLDLIRPELEAAIQKSILIEQEADRLIERLSTIDDSQEKQIIQRMQEHNQGILDNIQDEIFRNEVEEFLKLNI